MSIRRSLLRALALGTMLAGTATPALAQETRMTSTQGGIERRMGQLVLRIDALTDSVVRIRIGKNGTLPEDASWAARSRPFGLPGERGHGADQSCLPTFCRAHSQDRSVRQGIRRRCAPVRGALCRLPYYLCHRIGIGREHDVASCNLSRHRLYATGRAA